jgi:hypothetical protein
MKNYPIEAKREVRQLKKSLKELTVSVSNFLARIDLIMKERESIDRGKFIATACIATACNELDLDNQCAKHFGLNIPLNKLQNKAWLAYSLKGDREKEIIINFKKVIP